MYKNGTGVLQDHTEAARLATDQGNRLARDFLSTTQYPTGTRVQITGLAAAAHFNGWLGTVITPATPLAAGRIAVRIDCRSFRLTYTCRTRARTYVLEF